MGAIPTLDELRDLHRRVTYMVVQALLKGQVAPYGCWLYSEKGKPGTHPLSHDDLRLFFHDHDGSGESVAAAVSQLAKSYLVAGGHARTKLDDAGRPLPSALALVAPPHKFIDGEVVKTFVVTEHQLFLAESPVVGDSVRLADIELLDASLTHNQRPGLLN